MEVLQDILIKRSEGVVGRSEEGKRSLTLRRIGKAARFDRLDEGSEVPDFR